MSNPGTGRDDRKPRAAAVRSVTGRVRNQEAAGALWTFEMRKDKWDLKTGKVAVAGGVTVRRRFARKKDTELITFEHLTGGAARTVEVAGAKIGFRFGPDGVEVRRRGDRAWRLIDWAAVANMAQTQPLLFVEGTK